MKASHDKTLSLTEESIKKRMETQNLWPEFIKYFSPTQKIDLIKIFAFIKLKQHAGLCKSLEKPLDRVYEKAMGQFQASLTGSRSSPFIIREGKVYACGDNKYGQLGLGDTKSRDTPTEVTALIDEKIFTCAAGDEHSLFLSELGTVFACGHNECGQLGLSDKESRFEPIKVKALRDEKIIAIAAGSNYSLFLNESGKVFSSGSNKFGQLGLADTKSKSTPTEVSVLKGELIIAITAGDDFSLFLSKLGRVFSCGDNEYGQLGQGDEKARLIPTAIADLKDKKIVAIARGAAHSFFLSESGDAYSCGDNDHGQLGLGDEKSRVNPSKLTPLKDEKIIALAAGDSHSLALTESGKVYSCGDNEHGQLGLGDEEKRHTFTEVSALDHDKIIAIAAGKDYSLFLSASRKVFTCGKGAGQLGLKSGKKLALPTMVLSLDKPVEPQVTPLNFTLAAYIQERIDAINKDLNASRVSEPFLFTPSFLTSQKELQIALMHFKSHIAGEEQCLDKLSTRDLTLIQNDTLLITSLTTLMGSEEAVRELLDLSILHAAEGTAFCASRFFWPNEKLD